ncbi:hypothetical protein NNC19_14565 [Clostridium sp. SHJSY1]|uniref:hypothetical protein n=1 Tax=Clostridium sp. SHJSY1 TaxID=2942483 RepID=UPI002875C8BB|nr:hypothetical protein [Clostridium sp. SHJSY1]MDS0526912.1 hypothetical protein [Clostridium sp. SHJSY1]
MSKVDVLRKENNEFSKNLTKENYEIYFEMICYLRVSKLNEEVQEEVISDILRIFLDCQEQGNSIESAIGEDFKKFVDEIILAMNPRIVVFDKLKECFKIFIQASCILLTIDLISIYLPKMIKGNFNLNYDYTLDMLMQEFLIIILSIAIVNYICKNSFDITKKQIFKWKKIIIVCSFSLGFIILYVLTFLLKNIEVVSINVYYILPIPIIYWGYIGLKKVTK